jgi:hypothetical protein
MVLCRVGESLNGMVTAPYTPTGLLPLAHIGVPTERGWWVEGIESGHVTTDEYEGMEALQVRFEHDIGVGTIEDGTEIFETYFDADDPMKFLASVWTGESPSMGSWRMEVAWVESGSVLESSVSFSTDDFPYQLEGEPNPVTTTTVPPDSCPVTIPGPGFTPPADYPATPSDPNSVWYGNDQLWTAISNDGSYSGPRRSVWWSVNFPGGYEEEEPPIQTTFRLLNRGREVTLTSDRGINAYIEPDAWMMVVNIGDPNYSGCWEVTATYKGASLTYVYYNPGGLDSSSLGIVPDVVGMTVERAGNVLSDALYEAGFHDSADPTYEVCAQEPGDGLEINPGATIGMRTAPPGECEELMDASLNPNALYDTYPDQFGNVWYKTSCPEADVMITGGADGLPRLGQTWKGRVEQMILVEEVQAELAESDFFLGNPGVSALSAVPRNGEVWDQDDNNDVVVTHVADYMIEATIDDESACPSAPIVWNGIPVAFLLVGVD